AVFWDAVLATRDLLKFEFFFEPREEFRATIAAELAYQDRDWEMRLAERPKGARELLEQNRPLTAHTVLRSFIEAYGVVAAPLVRDESDEVEKRQFLAACLALGRQYQLQQRIRSPESLSKPFFANALELAANRGLVGPSSDRKARRAFLDEVRRTIRDIDVVESRVTDRIVTLLNSEPADSERAD